MDDTALVKVVAAQHVQARGPGAIQYLRDMQELAAALSDADSAAAWRDIEDAARTILLTGESTQADPECGPSVCSTNRWPIAS